MAGDNIVVVAIHDGFGNQLFQYAAGRGYAARTGAVLQLDTDASEANEGRPYGLRLLGIEATKASERDIRRLAPRQDRLTRVLRRLSGRSITSTRTCFKETKFYHFDDRMLTLRPHLYLYGYWQSARYFDNVREELKHEARVTAPIPEQTRRLRERIASTHSVCVHVRRGDYAGSIFRMLPVEYYHHAAAHMAGYVSAPVFYLFSNDPEWARDSLKLPGETVLAAEHSGGSFIEDFYLMRAARHFIIANSTFSWWPAWLGDHPDKITVAPARWFKREDWSAPELVEPGWHLL
ncbi:MAG: alpha-1,2-fucosyltransferase [Myxococcales bacterium]|nr:alpha-1,2-fucosyltransferase [Myxococcales bacterium]